MAKVVPADRHKSADQFAAELLFGVTKRPPL
jgi:hypothetical protein